MLLRRRSDALSYLFVCTCALIFLLICSILYGTRTENATLPPLVQEVMPAGKCLCEFSTNFQCDTCLDCAASQQQQLLNNASWDEDAIILRGSVNLGIAAATPRGLLVPNIKGAERLDLGGLASELDALIALACAGRTPPSDLADGTITVTNVGVFGVDSGTPILNPGETAILAVGQIRKKPWVVDDEIVVREICQLAVSADHRVVDGEVISKFLADVGRGLEHPAIML